MTWPCPGYRSTRSGRLLLRCVVRRRERAATRDSAFGGGTWRGHAGRRAISHFGDGDRVAFSAMARADDPAVIAFRPGVAPASLDTGGQPAPSLIAPVLARVARPDRELPRARRHRVLGVRAAVGGASGEVASRGAGRPKNPALTDEAFERRTAALERFAQDGPALAFQPPGVVARPFGRASARP